MYTRRMLELMFGFHKQTELSTRQHHAARAAYLTFAEFLERILPDGREKRQMFKALEEASMWAHKAIAQTAPLAPLPSEYKPLVMDEGLVGLLSRKIDMSEFVADGTFTEDEANRLANLPDVTGTMTMEIDPEPVSVEVSEQDVMLVDGVINEAIHKLVAANPQFTRPHISVQNGLLEHRDYRIILSQGPQLQDMPIRVDGPIEVDSDGS